MSHTEDSEMYEPHDVSRYPVDRDRARRKANWYFKSEAGKLVVVAVEVTMTIGEISRSTRYEFAGGVPVEVWSTGPLGDEVWVVAAEDADKGKFPWETPDAR